MRVTYLLSMGEPDQLADEAAKAVAEYGSSSFKIKVGSYWRDDVARVAAVRGAVGHKATIYGDANHEAVDVL